MRTENHNAWHLCRNRNEKVECVASVMRRLGEGCTAQDIMTCLGITKAELESVADDARALATRLSTIQTRATVPARRAA